jgi:AcrR family transcriptional regulator
VLRAAETLFAEASASKVVSMDDIAAAAGVGKGTLFRAFGNRDGLLDALFAARLDPLRAEITRSGSPLGPDAPPAARVIAILDELLTFKLENPQLIKARELTGSSLLQAPHYRWVHNLLRELIEETRSTIDAANYAHVLLGGLRVEVIAELLASGRSPEDLRRNLTAIAHRLLDS